MEKVRKRHDNFEVLVAWKGLIAAGDSWEPLQVMFEDVQFKVRDFFGRCRATAVARQAKRFISL